MNTPKIQLAADFARAGHASIGQKRKYTGEDYFVHCENVAKLVAENGGSEDMICAAYLHDLVEDVNTPDFNLDKINELFGAKVGKLVFELTDVYTKENYPDANRKKRKKFEAERVEGISNDAKTIKLADLIDNTESIAPHDKGFAVTFIKEELDLLGFLSDGNSKLLGRASQLALDWAAKLGIELPKL